MCSFTLGQWIIPFLSILVVQIGTMKYFYCPQKDASVVLWNSLSPGDQIFLRDKYPDAGFLRRLGGGGVAMAVKHCSNAGAGGWYNALQRK